MELGAERAFSSNPDCRMKTEMRHHNICALKNSIELALVKLLACENPGEKATAHESSLNLSFLLSFSSLIEGSL